jgi:uncharacterized protein YutE (UPF0331/DUF86 family)
MLVEPWSSEVERQALNNLQAAYGRRGYTVIVNPKPELLPTFLQGYRPDAIATKGQEKLAIEIKTRANPNVEQSLTEIRRLFEGQTDWQLVVSFLGSDALQRILIPMPSDKDVAEKLAEIRAMLAEGYVRAAFVMAWSFLEATLHKVENDETKRPRLPGTVVQSLAMLGLIEPDLEHQVRELIDLRNRIVHGDLAASPSNEDVTAVLMAVEQALNAMQQRRG